MVMSIGQQVPGEAFGVVYSAFPKPFDPLAFNAAGEVAVVAQVSGPGIHAGNDTGFWRGVPGSVRAVFREGAPAAAAGKGSFFGDANIGQIALNDRGDVFFYNELTGAGVTGANNGSLWFSDNAGSLFLVAREGDQLQVAPGDSRTIPA
jgi:hypothetical protein